MCAMLLVHKLIQVVPRLVALVHLKFRKVLLVFLLLPWQSTSTHLQKALLYLQQSCSLFEFRRCRLHRVVSVVHPYLIRFPRIIQTNQMEEEENGLNRSSHSLVRNSGLGSAVAPPAQYNFQNRLRHVYLEEENVYGRFAAFLLLKDKLKSQVDSSGTSALAHMCSHNSPYIPLYLSTLPQGDPILNKTTNLGHAPLDIAGMYCRREYVELLKAKGAVDDGRVDHWAIQGANIANWSGNVDVKKKELIPWAAYNNLPEVLAKFAELGANMNEPDQNGNTPIDLAVLNKCYESVEVLARLGLRPKDKLLGESQSPFLHELFTSLNRSPCYNKMLVSLKLTFVPLLLLSIFLMVQDANIYLQLISLGGWAILTGLVPKQDSAQRPTRFFSQLVNREINYASNHKIYTIFMTCLVLSCTDGLIRLEVSSFPLAIYYWILFMITAALTINFAILVYGICTNTTPNEMLESHKNPHLWKGIEYVIPRNMITRVYKNPNKKDIQTNIQEYLKS